nr:Chain Y, CYS-ARG-LEU-PRO-TRP-ASN-LEU-GLN-ARG-ILE-GLY-LEU-PRO-CYS [synthetic construct]
CRLPWNLQRIGLPC